MRAKIQVTDVDYVIEDDTPLVRVFGKSVDGGNVLAADRNFRPYFYAVPKADTREVGEEIEAREFNKTARNYLSWM